MRVISSGTEPQTRHTCGRCKCVFEYRPKDLQDFWSVTGHGQRYVVCPECDRKAVVSSYFADWKTGKLKEGGK